MNFKNTVPLLEAVGLSIQGVQLDMTAPPALSARIVADISTTNPEVIQQYIDKHSEKGLLVLILKGFIGAYEISDKLSTLGLNGLMADVKLSAPPSVSVRLLNNMDGALA